MNKYIPYLSILCLYIAAFGQFLYNSIAINIFLPIAFSFAVLRLKTIPFVGALKKYLFMWFFFIISFSFAIDGNEAFREIKMMLGVVLVASILYIIGNNKKIIPYFYGTYIIFYLGMIYFVQKSGILLSLDYQNERMDLEELNANCFGYYTFYLTSAIFILGDIVKNKRLAYFFKVLFLLMIPLTIEVALLTASRQIVVIQIPLISACIYIRYFLNSKKYWIYCIPLLILLIIVGDSVMSIFEDSLLSQRFQIKSEDDSRTPLIYKAIEVGFEHPLVGVGPGCFKLFTNGDFAHNTYLEIFANYGIFAAVYYIWFLGDFIITQWKRYKNTRENIFLTIFIIGVIFMLDNMFYVFYTGLWLMLFLFLLSLHSDVYYNQQKLNALYLRRRSLYLKSKKNRIQNSSI